MENKMSSEDHCQSSSNLRSRKIAKNEFSNKDVNDKQSWKNLITDAQVDKFAKEYSITTGYRKRLTYGQCFHSWFFLHNESVNIWTHFAGFAFFFYHFVSNLLNPINGKYRDTLPVYFQLFTYQVCMLSSTLFHTFSCHSISAHSAWLEFDHFGILFALLGTYIAFISDTFSCYPGWKKFHLIVVSVVFTFIILILFGGRVKKLLTHICNKIRNDFENSKEEKGTKIGLHVFIILAMYACIPFWHYSHLYGGLESEEVRNKLLAMAVPYGLAVVGICFYVSRFPENVWNCGTVDVFGASHQIWHVAVFVGMVFWYIESMTTYVLRDCSAFKTFEGNGKIEDLSKTVVENVSFTNKNKDLDIQNLLVYYQNSTALFTFDAIKALWSNIIFVESNN